MSSNFKTYSGFHTLKKANIPRLLDLLVLLQKGINSDTPLSIDFIKEHTFIQ